MEQTGAAMEQLEALLLQFMVPENQKRKAAEEQIRKLAKDSRIVPALMFQLRSAPDPNVRQLAAVILRKRVAGHWTKLAPDVRASSKAALLESVTADPSQPVRRASSNVVSVIAKYAVPSGDWPELLPFLFQCSQSAQEDHREVALILFTSLTETIGDFLRPHFGTLQTVFVNGLNDQHSNNVRVAALKAVGALVGYIQTEEEVVMFRELIPSILSVSRHCLQNGDEDVAVLAFEIFDELVESPAPLLGPTIPVIVQFALEVCSNKTLEPNTRYQAIQIISWLAKYKPKTLVRLKLLAPILTVMCPILAEPDARYSDSGFCADNAASEALDAMAMNLPRKQVFVLVHQFARTHYKNPDPNWREASVMALGVISEGCYEVMKDHLDDVLALVLESLTDGEQLVRGVASFALGQFAEHLQPEILEQYQKVLPCIFNVLNDSVPEVQEKAYYALAAFCEHLKEEEILPYLGPLMEKLLAALQSSRRDLQETSMSALGSTAAAAESAFVPYVETVLKMLQPFVLGTKDEDLPIRARATELVGIITMAVGRHVMEPVLPMFIEAALTGFSLDFSELREYSHGFFSNVAEVLGEGVTPYLPRMVPLAFSSCNLDDGTAIDVDDSDGAEAGATGLFGLSSDDDDDADKKQARNISIRTGVLDEKAAATQALGVYALQTKTSFMPYLEETLKILKKHAMYFHEDVRLQAMIALLHASTATRAAFPDIDNHVSLESKLMLDTAMDIYVRALNDDDDKDCVAQVCSSVVEVLKSVPFEAVQQYIEPLSQATLALLRQQALCQQTGDTDSDNDDEDAEHDEILMEAVTDILPAMAACMGPAFEPSFRQFFGPLMKFTGHSRSPSDKTMAMACIAEVTDKIGPAIMPYVDAVMAVALKELSSEEPTNRRNAAYCVGELCQYGGPKASTYYPKILLALHPLFSDNERDDGVRDNAAGAVARMINAQPQSIPLNQVLPVFIGSLPLKEDIEESATVYGCLCNLIFSSHQEIFPFVHQLVPVFAQVACSEDVKPEVKEVIGRAVTQLWNQYREQMQPLLSSLPPQEATFLSSIMHQSQ